MSKYIGEFTSLNGIDYKIEITSKTGTKTENVILGGTPFTTTGSDGETIYEPIKTTGATITLVTNSLPSDIYSGSTFDTKVHVTSGNKVIWTGYLTPCAYTQGFDLPFEELQLECVDGLSSLQDIPYSSDNKQIISFIDVVFKCLKKAECFKYLYVSNNMQMSESVNDAILNKIRINESNFFEEKDYESQPDNDVALSCYDVLFEICQYLNCSMLCRGEDVYIIDYDAVIKGNNLYYKYDISGSTVTTPVITTLTQTYNVKEGSYAESGTSIEMTPVYNKLTVKDEFYEIESAVEGLYNAKNWINITSPEDIRLFQSMYSGKFLENWVFTQKNKNGEDESFFIAVIKNWKDRKYFVYGKFYRNPMIKTYHYSDANNSLMDESHFNENMMWTKLWDGKGAVCVGLSVQDLDNDIYNAWHRKFITQPRPGVTQNLWVMDRFDDEWHLEEFGKLCGSAKITNKKLTNYILCLNYDQNHISHDRVTNYPYFTITKDVPAVFGGDDAYIIIQGTLIRHDEYGTPFPMGQKDDLDRKHTIYKGESFFYASLKWGDKYWQPLSHFGTVGGEWVNTVHYFAIPYGDYDNEQKAKDFFDKNMSIYNTATKVWGIADENGYYVPAPPDQNLEGRIELTVYANKDTKGLYHKPTIWKKDVKNSYDGYPPKVVLFKELDIKLVLADNTLNEEEAKSDTYYTNECDYPNVNEGDEVTCKICTYDDKKPSFSSPLYLNDSGESQYLDTIFDKSTGMNLRPEEHIVYKRVNMYEEPRLIFNANLKADLDLKPYCLISSNLLTGKQFIIDNMNVDYRFNKAECKMIEKNKTYK